MPAYNGKSKRAKNTLRAILTGIQFDAGGGSEQAMYVLDNSHGAFESYPAARILPGDVGNQKASVAENEREVKFLVMVHLPMEDTPESESATYDKMYDLTDLIMDTLDQADHDSTPNALDSTLDSYFLNVSRGDWYPVEENAGIMLVCDLDVTFRYSKELL